MQLYPEGMRRWQTHSSNIALTEDSVENMRSTLRLFHDFMADRAGRYYTLDEVTREHVVAFLVTGTRSANTIATYRRRLNAWFTFATHAGLVITNPVAGVGRDLPRATGGTVEHNWLTAAEVKAILALPDLDYPIGLRDAVILRLGFTVGLRRSEIVGLRFHDVDLHENQARVKGKGGKLATVYLNDPTVAVMRRLYKEGPKDRTRPVVSRFQVRMDWSTKVATLTPLWNTPLAAGHLSRLCVAYSSKAKVKFAPHDMRRTFAGMVHENAGIEAASKALRHSNLGVTQRYLESRQDAAFLAVRDAGVTL